MLLFSVISSSQAENSANFISIIDQKLKTADKIRSSDPVLYNSLLEEIQKFKAKLTDEQYFYLKYLQAYQLTFQGDPKKGLKKFKELVKSDASNLLKFRANVSIVNILANSQKWNDGLFHLSNVLDSLPSIKDKEIYQLGLAVAAVFYNQLGQYELGNKYANRLLAIASDNRNHCMATGIILESKFKLK